MKRLWAWLIELLTPLTFEETIDISERIFGNLTEEELEDMQGRAW